MHGSLKSIEGPPNLGINLPLSIKPTTQNSANQIKEDVRSMNGKEKLENKSPSPVKKPMDPKKMAILGWTCWECDRLFTQRDLYISHVRKEHGKVRVKAPPPPQPLGVRKRTHPQTSRTWVLGLPLSVSSRVTSKITQSLSASVSLSTKGTYLSSSNLVLDFANNFHYHQGWQ